MEKNENEIEKLAEEKMKTGLDLIQQLSSLQNIEGVKRIQKKILAEVSTLRRVRLYELEFHKENFQNAYIF